MSVQRAREAAARGEWEEAYDVLVKADAGGFIGAGELPLLGEVAYAAGRLDVSIETWERTYALCAQAATLWRRQARRFASRCTCFWTPR